MEVLWPDRGDAVEQRVDQREADRVRLGAGGELAGEPLGGLGERGVGVPPQLARVGGELDAAGALGVLERGREVAGEPGVFERVRVAAFGQQPDASDPEKQKPVQQSVGDLDRARVAAQLGLGDVTDDRDVSVGRAGGRGAGQHGERPTVPSGAQGR